MNQLNKTVLEKACESGICHQWATKIANASGVDELLQMYVDGIDFCLAKDFPSNTDLMRLGGDKLANYGIYGDNKEVAGNPPFAVLLGDSAGHLIYEKYAVAQVFVKHGSTVTIDASGNCFVMVDCFDESNVFVIASGSAHVVLNRYGNAGVGDQCSDNAVVKFTDKDKATY